MNLETKITIYKFTPQLFTLTLDFANSVAFFKAFEKAINTHHTSLFFSCLTIPISGVKK